MEKEVYTAELVSSSGHDALSVLKGKVGEARMQWHLAPQENKEEAAVALEEIEGGVSKIKRLLGLVNVMTEERRHQALHEISDIRTHFVYGDSQTQIPAK